MTWFSIILTAFLCTKTRMVLVLAVQLLDAFTVKFFAESEFKFSSIKVMAINLFILLGGAAMFGLIPVEEPRCDQKSICVGF